MVPRPSTGRFRSFVIVVLMALALLPAAPLARAANPITVSFAYTGAEQTFVVPQGVASLHVEAVGGTGGGYFSPVPPRDRFFPGGAGGRVSADIVVQAGATLYIAVGGNGSLDSGGFNGGAPGGGQAITRFGVGGGGASVVKSSSWQERDASLRSA